MHKSVVLVSLLVLGWTRTLQGLPVLPDPLYPTQENFDLSKFLGKWYDVAKASTYRCMHGNRGDLAIGKLMLQKGTTEGKLKMTRTALRGGTCKERTGDYELTSTPGRFFYHVAKWGADVDAYVVHTNYNEYAIMIMSKQNSTGDKSISLKLYSKCSECRMVGNRERIFGETKYLSEMFLDLGKMTVFLERGHATPGRTLGLDLNKKNAKNGSTVQLGKKLRYSWKH